MRHDFAKALTTAVLTLMISVTRAEAHASLVSANPAASSIAQAPSMIELHFSEALEPKFSGFAVTRDGANVAMGDVTVGKDTKTLMAMPSMPLSPGDYKVNWHAVAADSHRSTGSYGFSVK